MRAKYQRCRELSNGSGDLLDQTEVFCEGFHKAYRATDSLRYYTANGYPIL